MIIIELKKKSNCQETIQNCNINYSGKIRFTHIYSVNQINLSICVYDAMKNIARPIKNVIHLLGGPSAKKMDIGLIEAKAHNCPSVITGYVFVKRRFLFSTMVVLLILRDLLMMK